MAESKQIKMVVKGVDTYGGLRSRIVVDEEGKVVGLAFGTDRLEVEFHLSVLRTGHITSGAVEHMARQFENLSVNLKSMAERLHKP